MIVPQEIYHPLYTDTDKFIILITGGRGSGKSFNASTFIERLTFEMTPVEKIVHQVLYTRYTMVSAGMSIIPEMMEKIELDGTTKYFKTTKTDIVNKMTNSRIMFRGIKTSSGNQTAKLKSIQGITTFVCDEAEEWTNEEEFDKIMLSIRKKGIQNRIIIIMNPCDSHIPIRITSNRITRIIDTNKPRPVCSVIAWLTWYHLYDLDQLWVILELNPVQIGRLSHINWFHEAGSNTNS